MHQALQPVALCSCCRLTTCIRGFCAARCLSSTVLYPQSTRYSCQPFRASSLQTCRLSTDICTGWEGQSIHEQAYIPKIHAGIRGTMRQLTYVAAEQALSVP